METYIRQKKKNVNFETCYEITDFIFNVFIKQGLKGGKGVQFLQRMAIKPARVGNCAPVFKWKPGSSSFSQPLVLWILKYILNATYPLFAPSTFSYMTRREVNCTFHISMYPLSALGYSSNLIGSLSRTMTLYSQP